MLSAVGDIIAATKKHTIPNIMKNQNGINFIFSLIIFCPIGFVIIVVNISKKPLKTPDCENSNNAKIKIITDSTQRIVCNMTVPALFAPEA